jgi:hypothetical protein
VAYASTSDVQARVPHPTLTTTTKPSTTQVAQWLVEADAMLNGAAATAGLTTPVTGDGAEILKSWASDYGEGHVRTALAAAGNDGTNDSGKDLLEQFRKNLESLRLGEFNQMLASGAASGSARVRSYPLNNQDGVTVESDGIVPEFTRAAGVDQW